jgi:hypothetical protein
MADILTGEPAPATGPDAPIVCTLDPDDGPERVREWQAVLQHVEARHETADGVELRFARDPDVLAALAAVAAKEVACCSFFTFIVSIDATAARVAIVAPPDGVPLVRELFGAVDQPVAATRVSAANEQ